MTHASNSTAARDIACMLYPYTHLGAHEERGPITMTRGKSMFVRLNDLKPSAASTISEVTTNASLQPRNKPC
jgi:hypothetical protein